VNEALATNCGRYKTRLVEFSGKHIQPLHKELPAKVSALAELPGTELEKAAGCESHAYRGTLGKDVEEYPDTKRSPFVDPSLM
jgi:hypothetical protein